VVGVIDGVNEGVRVGADEEGVSDGDVEGEEVGGGEGDIEGVEEGEREGAREGVEEGEREGFMLGSIVGAVGLLDTGKPEGEEEGIVVGISVGEGVLGADEGGRDISVGVGPQVGDEDGMVVLIYCIFV